METMYNKSVCQENCGTPSNITMQKHPACTIHSITSGILNFFL